MRLRAPHVGPLNPKDMKGVLAETNTIAHAEMKKTKKSMTTEMIDEGDHDGEVEANEEEFLRTMEKTALRAPRPTATPSPSGMLTVRSPPEMGLNAAAEPLRRS